MNCKGIIIEGLTGAGKTHTLKALLSTPFIREQWSPYDLFREKETFGEFMGELLDRPDAPVEHKFRLLAKAIGTATTRARQSGRYRFIMERVHYSYYALLPDWDLYKDFDKQLASLNPHVYLLWIPHELLKSRSLFRLERQGWANRFIDLYGSEKGAIDSFSASQSARREALRKSAIPHTIIDTSTMDWDRYASHIIEEPQRSNDVFMNRMIRRGR